MPDIDAKELFELLDDALGLVQEVAWGKENIFVLSSDLIDRCRRQEHNTLALFEAAGLDTVRVEGRWRLDRDRLDD